MNTLNIILVIIVTAVIMWKIIYTIEHILNFLKEKNTAQVIINIILSVPYILYFYFLWEAVTGKLEIKAAQQSWIIFIFILLTFINVIYDFKLNSIDKKED